MLLCPASRVLLHIFLACWGEASFEGDDRDEVDAPGSISWKPATARTLITDSVNTLGISIMDAS